MLNELPLSKVTITPISLHFFIKFAYTMFCVKLSNAAFMNCDLKQILATSFYIPSE